jgi:hypothetical protein
VTVLFGTQMPMYSSAQGLICQVRAATMLSECDPDLNKVSGQGFGG